VCATHRFGGEDDLRNDIDTFFIKVSVKPFQRLAGQGRRPCRHPQMAKFFTAFSFGYFSLGLLPSKKSNNKQLALSIPR